MYIYIYIYIYNPFSLSLSNKCMRYGASCVLYKAKRINMGTFIDRFQYFKFIATGISSLIYT